MLWMNTADLLVPLFVFLLVYSARIHERTRVTENNLLLSSPGSCLLPQAVAASGVAPEAEIFVGPFGELRSDPGFCLCANSHYSGC